MTLHPSVAAVRLPVRAALAGLAAGDTVAVACSGGADSLALASATVFEARRPGLRVVGVTVDHGLQEGSREQAERVVAQLAAMGVDETLTARVAVDVTSGLGPEAAAREARYAVLEQVAEHLGARLVLLGHTLDDQAETVLLGLARGSGGRSLQGMRPAFGVFARPLLGVRRSDTVTACLVEGLEAWDDPHNHDPGYTRVRVRERVLPVLESELGPGVAEALARTAGQLREDTALLDGLAGEALARARRDAPPAAGLDVATLAAEPPAIRHRVVHRAALDAGAPASELGRDHVLAVDALLVAWRGQKWIDLPGPLRAIRRDGLLVLEVP
ncbi:tRNA(Ile)-lysidine synthase [Nocardioides flavus (ex Wang et al. 2016)]|uniref:tRNA(Ile)-lysidine synthase n=1 Tax=Nocardioides flavus (ex Wang et al. 2016) TaxID=2058780 RepID=A0ABQ3HIS1_9ACTN|nr:tRNA lysidine(34) synthetase TilS [Nocardioides flavus (ex Wang et al. 2016)]GHE16621.1 tRNA(Ile)-lysidine synthase [Nocardioides flavus (ex Wang et al. 2016)]